MKRWHSVMWWAVITGTAWGMFELFAGDLMRAYDVPFRVAILTAVGVFILATGRACAPKLGFATLAGVVACTYKLASAGFFPCQIMAVMIHAVTFDVLYDLLERQIRAGAMPRMILPVSFSAVSFTLFGVFSLYVIPEPYWVERGWAGIGHYLYTSGLACAILSAFTFEWGVQFGEMLQGKTIKFAEQASPAPAVWATAFALAGWGFGVVSALV